MFIRPHLCGGGVLVVFAAAFSTKHLQQEVFIRDVQLKGGSCCLSVMGKLGAIKIVSSCRGLLFISKVCWGWSRAN